MICYLVLLTTSICHSHHSFASIRAQEIRNCFVTDSRNFLIQVRLLKDILEAWKAEVEKKPPTMSISDAYETLQLPVGVGQYVKYRFIL